MSGRLDQIYINGAWQRVTGPELTPFDPATERPSGVLVSAQAAQVTEAVQAARAAFDGGWNMVSRDERLALLTRLKQAMQNRAEQFAQTISAEIGTPIDFARSGQVDAAMVHLDATISALKTAPSDQPLTSDPYHRVRYDPLGVAALITPWNWPLSQVVLKLAAALAAGCTMVLKPSEYSTKTAVLLTEAVHEAGVPAGVFNLLIGDRDTGRMLVTEPGVDVVSFTGSTRAGRQIAAEAAEGLVRTTLELGGKSPNILFKDCDLPLAIRQGMAHCFRNAGQSCNAASRMFVAREIYDQAVELARAEAEATQVGLPDQPGPHIGPLVNASQFERVQGLIETGQTEGARLITGGPGRMPGFETGYFARPTVFADVRPEMTLFREEVFGPVLTMTPFDTESDAVALANATPYGLAAYIQTADAARADRVAQALRVGMVQVNGTSRESGAPFGGRGQSGWGREAGLWGIRAFQDIKSISGTRRV
ncbi:aldehyde dehydrogenase family protein [Actibacterium pelagium]|uniref:aldehyde dehydrogenase (NAD(+)) n=1 Tax=Actibacterium pelagium TaxID=2029103 RepID=A0A917A9T7_9RHOB|nr:aldehyde dehydrogenase family protein [Actibacterium pelagium]GGE37276.1 aldehyde dehydrogenase [Actibacterium pelagium]